VRSSTGRLRILSTHNGFHGKTLGALSATGKPQYQIYFGAPVEGFDFVPFGDLKALEEAFQKKEEDKDQYAAFIVEPIQGEGGVRTAPKGYFTVSYS
jgi:acetylornithine/succinyldiaminopimelate/putrescine aminotransferase